MSDDVSAAIDTSYRVRVHPRARHVRLRMDPRDGLVVTVPARFDRRRLPALLEQRAEWIHQARRRQASARAELEPGLLGRRPQRVELAAVARSWQVVYEPGSRARLGFREEPDRLILQLPALDPEQIDERVASRLRRWLMERARSYLPEKVAELAAEHGFRYRNVQIRNQHARWGSCSSRGNLSLNARLLFCSPAACDYVLLHELVHTVHPDHSPAFWGRVAELMPDYRRQQDSLKEVWLRLPDWI
ncbi:YgjP-like metallopeptidase domain-containing protein [Wenzhouxiangella limi]|uniref:M48 family metallopeptidase n=1 Tax=Wenzhouxiangella limi TaxID=2707351 RepID=A0A845V5J2_9GAMM|nr:M48 family metallopeptidase [Wenzhouxiangella limi]